MRKILVSIGAIAGLVAVVAVTTSLWAQRGPDARAEARREAAVEPRQVVGRGPLMESERSLVSLFDQAAPSVAYITTENLVRQGFFGERLGIAQGSGSGFVWDTQGHIVTNNHVVENAERVLVQLDAGKDPVPARVVGTAPAYDLAVVKLASVPPNLRPIPLGASRELKVGQSVIAIGNPFGLSRTLTTGIISALNRYLPTQEYIEIADAIQTDAAINPGNSGGPLLDSAGRLIGVNTAIRSSSGSSAGVGFAIPSDIVNRVVPQLIARGVATFPGIGAKFIDPELVARSNIKGVVIDSIARGTPADEAGLRPYSRRTGDIGDVITAVNGRSTDTLATFVAELDRVGVGNVAELTVVRDKKERKEKVRVIDINRRSTGVRV
jgi:2-alkenal reductase